MDFNGNHVVTLDGIDVCQDAWCTSWGLAEIHSIGTNEMQRMVCGQGNTKILVQRSLALTPFKLLLLCMIY
jgi:hypothetical protein